MKLDIAQALEHLDWTRPEYEQAEARQYLALHIGQDLSPLMVEALDKQQFENAVRVLAEIGQPRIEAYIPQLLEWFKDLNWPGALSVSEMLQAVDKGILIPHVIQTIQRAQDEGDDLWAGFLEDFHQLIMKHKTQQERNAGQE